MSGRLRIGLLLGCALLAVLYLPGAVRSFVEGVEGPYPGANGPLTSAELRLEAARAAVAAEEGGATEIGGDVEAELAPPLLSSALDGPRPGM